jgi:hypothetical protein
MIDFKKIVAFGCIGWIAAGALAQTAPSTQAHEQTLTATITDVVGNVQEREGENQPWRTAVAGMEIGEGGEFRTAPRSAVRFTIPGGQTITLDRLGVMKILTAIEQNGKITTDLGLKYGRTRYDIRKADVQYSATIRSPGSTLAIRGTDVIYEDSAPFPPSATSLEGRARFRNVRHQFINFGGVGKSNVNSNNQGPGNVALDSTTDDPRGDFSGHDSTEDKITTDDPMLAGFEPGSSLSILSVLQSTRTQETINTPFLTGPLEFDLLWQSVDASTGTASPTNLDLAVTDPLGNTISKDNPQAGTGSAIGLYSGDNPGTSGSGTESVLWGQQFPQGEYQLSVNSVSGDPAQVIVTVSRDNQTIKTIGSSPTNPLILTPGQTFTTSIDVGAGADTVQGAVVAATKRKRR